MESFSTKRISQSNQLNKLTADVKGLRNDVTGVQNGLRNISEALNVLVQVVGPETYETALAEYRLQVTEANVARAVAEGALAEVTDAVLALGQGQIIQLVERLKDSNEPVPPGKAYLEFDQLTEEGKKLLGGSTTGVIVTGPNGNTLEVTKIFVRQTPAAPAPAAAPALAAVPDVTDAEIVEEAVEPTVEA